MIPAIKAALPAASIRLICATLGINRSWYYARQRLAAPGGDASLTPLIEAIILRHPG